MAFYNFFSLLYHQLKIDVINVSKNFHFSYELHISPDPIEITQ